MNPDEIMRLLQAAAILKNKIFVLRLNRESGDHAFSVVLGAARVPVVSAKGADGGTLTAPHAVEQPPTAQIQLSNNRHLQAEMRSSR